MKRSLRVRLAAFVALTGTAGCTADTAGGKPPADPAGAAVARAARATEGVSSLHYRITGRTPQQGRIRTEGWFGSKPAAGRVRITTLGGEHPGTLELRLVDRHLYASVHADEVRENQGRHWLDFGPTAKFRSGGGLPVDMTAMRDEAARNPAREAAFLGAAGDVRRSGTDTVDGTRTTHYTGTVTVAALRRRLRSEDAPGRAGREQSLAEYAKQGVDKLTLDVWLDGEDHVRRQRVRGSGRHGALDLTVTFTGFDRPLSVRAPAAADAPDVRKPAPTSGG